MQTSREETVLYHKDLMKERVTITLYIPNQRHIHTSLHIGGTWVAASFSYSYFIIFETSKVNPPPKQLMPVLDRSPVSLQGIPYQLKKSTDL